MLLGYVLAGAGCGVSATSEKCLGPALAGATAGVMAQEHQAQMLVLITPGRRTEDGGELWALLVAAVLLPAGAPEQLWQHGAGRFLCCLVDAVTMETVDFRDTEDEDAVRHPSGVN